MADFRITRRKKSDAVAPAPEVTPEKSQSILSQVGGGALSGLHTIGSILSTPSRVLWGGINGLSGGEGGFGNMNPFDSTGGVELSKVLGNAGAIAKNDPNKWEWGDLGRGVVDILGDPTSWLGVGGLTRAGVAASRTARVPISVEAIRRGERGLVSFRPPLSTTSRGAVGTGAGVADTLENIGNRTGITRASQAVRESAPITFIKKKFHASAMERSTPATQQMAERAYHDTTGRLQETDLSTINTARNMQARQGGPIAADAERHMIEMGRPSPEVGELLGRMNAAHAEAQDLGIPTGDLANTVKPFTKVGAPRALQTHVLDAQGNVVRTIDNTRGGAVRPDAAPANYLTPNQAVQYAPRQIAEGIEWGGQGGDASRKAMSAQSSLNQHRNEELFGNASTDMVNRAFQRAGEHMQTLPGHLTENQRAREIGKFVKREFRAEDIRSGTNLTGNYFAGNHAHSRPREIGNFIAANPQVAQTGPFTNHVVADIHNILTSMDGKNPKAREAISFMARNAAATHNEPLDVLRRHGMDNPPTIREAANQLGVNEDRVIHHALGQLPQPVFHDLQRRSAAEAMRLAQHRVSQNGGDVDEIAGALLPNVMNQMALDLQLPSREFKSLTGFLDRTPAQQPGLLKDYNTVLKANLLAHPATHSRNAVSAGVTNLLQGSAGPVELKHGIDLVRGLELTGYDQVPAVARLMQDHGISQTEALRRIMATHAPVNQSIVGDLPQGQIGSQLQDLASNVPGQTVTRASEAVTGPLRALAGYDGANHVGWNAINPTAIGGAFGHEQTRFGPAMASNMAARNIEQPVRIAGILGLLRQGYSPEEAARIVGKSQVNYGSREYSQFEKKIKSVVPFYSFSSRQGKHVAQELATDPGGRMAQLVKAQDRAHASDATIPDSVLSGTAIPLGEGADGTKRFFTGLGLAHEPAVHTLGALANLNLRGAGYDLLGMLNPLYKTPLEHVTGQSFYQRGEPSGNLTPNVGQTLANLGAIAGIRDGEAGPVKYPGQSLVENAVQMSPLSRVASTARTLTDTRKDLASKLGNTLSGLKVTDISPAKQSYTLMRRAQDLAQESGAKPRVDVYFSKSELAALEKTNPTLAKKQRELQALMTALRGKKAKSDKKKKKAEEFRLSRTAK